MTSTPISSNQKLEERKLKREKRDLKSTINEILEFSKIVKEKINSNNFDSDRTEKQLYDLIFSISEKVDFSYKSLHANIEYLLRIQQQKDISFLGIQQQKDIYFLYLWSILNDIVHLRIKSFLGIQQQKDISFLYLWSTLNDIVHLRIKITLDEWTIFKREGKKKSINPQLLMSCLNDNDYDEKEIKKLIEKFICKVIIKKNSITKFFKYHSLEFIRLVLFYESKEQLKNFRLCRARRNVLPLTHRSVFDEQSKIDYEDITNMKELIEILFYLK